MSSPSTGPASERSEDGSTGEMNELEEVSYDYIMEEHIGQLGKFQLIMFLVLCLPSFFPGIVVMSFSFVGGVPDYRCKIPGCDNTTDTEFQPPWLDDVVPDKPNRLCHRYNSSWTDVQQCHNESDLVNKDQLIVCNEWVYDQSIFRSTIVSEFNLVCDDEWIVTLASTSYMFGMFFGAVVCGQIADLIGRRKAFSLISLVLASVFTASAFSPDYITFTVLRFFCGVTGVGFFLVLYVWGVESVGPKYRVMCGFVYQIVFTLGSITLGGIAYLAREWRTTQLIISVPLFVFIFYYWILPESIRWLIIKKRYSEAEKLILKAAKINGKSVPPHLLLPFKTHGDETRIIACSDGTIHDAGNSAESGKKRKSSQNKLKLQSGTIFDIFRNWILCKRILIMFSSWIAALMSYYGLTMAASTLAGDFYLNYELSMIVEVPSYIFGIYIMDRVGRRFTLSVNLIIGGIACLTAGLVPEDPAAARIAMSLIGKFCVSCVLATVYSYTAELFPTATRSAAVGMCSTSGRIGSILAPIITSLGRTADPATPYIIFGCVNLVVGLLTILLPETKGIDLPATIEEAENLEKFTLSIKKCCKK